VQVVEDEHDRAPLGDALEEETPGRKQVLPVGRGAVGEVEQLLQPRLDPLALVGVRDVLGNGVEVTAPPGQRARAAFVNTRLEKTHWGLSAHGAGSVNVTARDAVSSGNKNGGFLAYGSSGVRMLLQDCVASNQSVGVRAYDSARVTAEGYALANLTLGVFVNNLGDVRLSD
jgi:hypothetical protein